MVCVCVCVCLSMLRELSPSLRMEDKVRLSGEIMEVAFATTYLDLLDKKTTQPVDEHKSDDDKHEEQPDKQSYKPRPFEDPRGYQGKEVGCLEQDAGWLEQHYKAMRAPGLLSYKDVRYIKLQ